MIIQTDSEMVDYGKRLAKSLTPPVIIELIGDVGVGKTTLVRGIASGLDIDEPVTSPSFVINKKYRGANNITLSHYDFYRLNDAGIMKAELDESVHDPQTITIVEWGKTVADILPPSRQKVHIKYNDDGTRTITTTLLESQK